MGFFIVGVFSGIVTGMGIGGGIILIPALVLFFGVPQQTVQGISLFYYIPVAITALAIHVKHKKVEFKIGLPIVAFGLIGAVGGASLAMFLSGAILQKVFGVFLILLGLYELRKLWMAHKMQKSYHSF